MGGPGKPRAGFSRTLILPEWAGIDGFCLPNAESCVQNDGVQSAEQAARPLTPLLDLWAKAQERGRAERYVRQKRDLIKRIAAAEGWESVSDLCSRDAVEWLANLTGSTRTHNNSLSVLKTFGDWLVMVSRGCPIRPVVHILGILLQRRGR